MSWNEQKHLCTALQLQRFLPKSFLICITFACRFLCDNPLKGDDLAADVVQWQYEVVRRYTDPGLLQI